MKCKYGCNIGMVWIIAYFITIIFSTIIPTATIILIVSLFFIVPMCKQIINWIKNTNAKLFYGIVLAVFLMPIILTSFGIGSILCFNFDFTETGQIGDTIGGITTPLLSTIAAYYAFKTFVEDKNTNKKSLQQQKEELFKNEFFNMLQTQRILLNDIKGSFSYRYSGKTGIVSGVSYFNSAQKELNAIFEILDKKELPKNLEYNIKKRYNLDNLDNISSEEEKIKLAYKKFYSIHPELGNYFRHFYHILKRLSLEENKIDKIYDKDDPKREEDVKTIRSYADIFQATLTFDEMILINYNCFQFDNSKELVKHYDFLQNLAKTSHINPNHIVTKY